MTLNKVIIAFAKEELETFDSERIYCFQHDVTK